MNKREEKNVLKEMYVNTIEGKKRKLLWEELTYSDYLNWVNQMGNHLIELGYPSKEVYFIIEKASRISSKTISKSEHD